ncbi:MAG: acyl-CoA dehydrogenase [Pseudonocardiales bacterium]|nr:acyl-CoA dehydrogenase [Pseudonocardiales bacterium]
MSVRSRGPQFTATELRPDELALQQEVRDFLDAELPRGSYHPGLGMNAPASREFSRKLGARGWLGMALPKKYGGGERSAVERFIVTEELITRGAPVAHHWLADRQTGSTINAFGTEEQKERFLPHICSGELGFSVGMSEPEAGSDLAGLRTRATKVEGGWLLDGTKVWTTGAHRNDWMTTLCRSSDEPDRRQGLTQYLVALDSPGLKISPIPFLDGTADFNEVVLEGVFVPDDLVLGDIGRGWGQNTAELAFERGGPDRYLSSYVVIEQFLRESDRLALSDAVCSLLGKAVATWWGLRQLSLASVRSIDAGRSPVLEAALVKEVGTRFEQDVVEALLAVIEVEPSPDSKSVFQQLLSEAIVSAPSFTLRGGTNEILRSVVSKGLLT